MGKKTPPPPDYTGAAEAQAGASADINRTQTYANRPTQNTPWGTVDWETSRGIDPATGEPVTNWTQNMTLDPQSQAALDSQMRLQSMRSGMAEDMYGRVRDEFGPTVNFDDFTQMGGGVSPNNYSTEGLSDYGDPVQAGQYDPSQLRDFGGDVQGGQYDTSNLSAYGSLGTGGLPDVSDPTQLRQRAEDATYDSFTSRLDPRFEQRAEAVESQLRNQGLRPGDQAYDEAMANFAQERNDAYQQAAFQANAAGRAEAGQLFGQESQRRGQFFDERGQVGQFANQTRGQQFGEMLGAGGQRFNEAFTAAQRADQQRGQQLSEMLGMGSQRFGEQLSSSQQNNQTREQQMSEMLRTGAANFSEGMDSSRYETQRRQQQIAEEMQRRGFSLNEINSLLTGQQVGMPNMPDFNQANKSETPQYLNAAGQQYDAALDGYNSRQAAMQGLMSGVGSIGSAFMPM